MLRPSFVRGAFATLLLAACAGPGDKLATLDARLAEDPTDRDALRRRIELLSRWEGGPEERLAIAAADAQRLGGDLLLPEHAGGERWFLTDDERADVREAVRLLERALEWDASGEHRAFTLARLVEAHALLAEDERNRTSPPTANDHDRYALDWASRLVQSYPDDPHGPYGRGLALLRLGDARGALDEFERCEELCDARLATTPASGETRDLRFQSQLRRAECFGRLELVGERVAVLERAFGQVAAESAFAVSAAYRDAGDVGRARGVLLDLLEGPGARREPRLFLELACLAALDGDQAQARALLERCLAEGEFDTSTPEGANLLAYSALWRWMLTADEAARVEVAELVAGAPIGSWERTLLAFTAWETLPEAARARAAAETPSAEHEPGSEPWLLAAARLELTRRMLDNLDPDDLRAEAWFYLGWKRRSQGLHDAEDAFRHCLELADPHASKWEFDFARRYLDGPR